MKILRIFGVVAGIHLVALLLIFADPGCSVGRTQTAQPDAAPPPEAQPAAAAEASPITPAPADTVPPITFNAGGATGGAALYAPTRPDTPAAAALVAPQVSDVVPAATYVVVSGDSLWSIARKNHLKVSDLASANNLRKGASIQPGQKLIIPQRSLGPEGSGGPAVDAGRSHASGGEAAAPGHHIVKSGESLRSIAHRFHVRMSEIAAANSISDPKSIYPGEDLVIPSGHATAAATPAPSPEPEAAPAPAPAAAAAPAPAPGQDLDAGLKPSATGDIPVVKVDDSTGQQK